MVPPCEYRYSTYFLCKCILYDQIIRILKTFFVVLYIHTYIRIRSPICIVVRLIFLYRKLLYLKVRPNILTKIK